MMNLDKVKFSEPQKIFLWVFATVLCFFALFTFDGLFPLETFFLVLLLFPVFFSLFKILNSRNQDEMEKPEPLGDEGRIIVKRDMYDEDKDDDDDFSEDEESKGIIHLSIYVSNGVFSGLSDVYCRSEDLIDIGNSLVRFPQKVGDKYSYIYAHELPDYYFKFFEMRAFTRDPSSDCALEFLIDDGGGNGKNCCRFSFITLPEEISRLGYLFIKLAELKHSEFHWDNESDAIYETLQQETEQFFPIF